ncbi:MAG: ADP-ribosylglycohydrolase family protein [Chthonomonadales bacterium]
MQTQEILRSDLLDRLHGVWLGKMIGATLGAPIRGRMIPANLNFFEPVPGQATATEFVDFQLLWLDCITRGDAITSDGLAANWIQHIDYRWDEYGWARWNLDRGLEPPMSGAFNNPFSEASGAMFRSEIWGMLAPGEPIYAAKMAYGDAVLDHATEGVWAAMAWSAAVSATLAGARPLAALDVAGIVLPINSRCTRAMVAAKSALPGFLDWADARNKVIEASGCEDYTDAAVNIGLAALALIYGKSDFAATLLYAANAGYGADGIASMAGAIMGASLGASRIPERWCDPIGDSVIPGWGLHEVNSTRKISELAQVTLDAAEKWIEASGTSTQIVDELTIPEPPPSPEPIPEPVPEPVIVAETPIVSSIESVPAPETVVAAVEDEDEVTVKEIDLSSPPVEEPAGTPIIEPAEPVAFVSEPVDVAPVEVTPAAPPPKSGLLERLTEIEALRSLQNLPACSSHQHIGDFLVTIDYGNHGPTILPGVAGTFVVTVKNEANTDMLGTVQISAPDGWQVAVPGAQGQRQALASGRFARFGFVVKAPESANIELKNTLQLVITPEGKRPVTVDIPFLGGSCWNVVGPFRNFVEEGYDHVYEPEFKPGFDLQYLGRNGGMIGWQKRAFRLNELPFEEVFSGQPGVAYASTSLHIERAMDAKLMIHTTDGVRAWLNGERVLQWHSHDAFRPTLSQSPATADIKLKAGQNDLLLKVVRCGKPVRFAWAIVDMLGKPIADLGNSSWTPSG